MAPLTVDPAALDGAGAATISAGQGLGPVISTLTSALSGCSGMAGDDPAGAAFGRSYNSSSSKLLEAMATTRNGLCRLGDGVRMSAHNYSVAEAMSNLSGHGEPLPVPPPTGPVSAGSAPSAVGDSTGAPAGWGWVAPFIGMIWPTGDSAKLRAAAAAWLSAGTNFEVTEIQGVAGPMGTIGAQQIPEIPAITTAFGDAVRSASGILQQCVSIATQLGAYATKIDTVHAAILDLLSRICDPTTGLKEVVEFLTDQDEDEIKKIANDIRTIVNNFTAEVKALCQEIATLVSEAETIITTMGRYAEKEWDQFLHHTAVGRALDQVGQFGKGVAEEAGGLIKDGWDYGAIRPFFDPKGSYDSWSQLINGMAPLVGLGGDHAPGVAQAWKDLGKNAVHWDEWKTNPAEAAGKSTFDIASFFVPGGGEAAAASKGARAAVDGAEAAAKTAPKEAAAARALEDVPKSAPHAPEPHAPPHDGPTPPHEPPGGRPEPAPQPERAEHHGPAESKAPHADRPLAEGEPKSPVEPASPGHGSPPPPGGSPPPPGQGPPPPDPHPPMPGAPTGEGVPPPAEPPPLSAPPSGDGLPPAEPPQPAPTSPSGEVPPPADAPHQPAPSTPPGDGHLPPAEEPQPTATVPSAEDHTPAHEEPQPVAAAPSWSGHPSLDGEHLPASAAPPLAPVSAGGRSAELAPKDAYTPQPRSAGPPSGRADHLLDEGKPPERTLPQNTEPRGGRPASLPPTSWPRGDAAVSHLAKALPHTDKPSGLGDGTHLTGRADGGDGHGGHGHGGGEPPHDPVHTHEPSGEGWERLGDEPRHPHYGEPLEHYWQYPHDPTNPSQIHPDVAKLMTDPDAPFGRDPKGHAYTQHEYEERFNKEGPDGQRWYNFASDDGALEGSKVAFNDLEQYKKFYGHQLDRIGDEDGKYLGVIEDGKFAPWEARAMHVDSLGKPLHSYTIDYLPQGWKVEVSEIEPAVGQPGGAMQVRILDAEGDVMVVKDLLKAGILR